MADNFLEKQYEAYAHKQTVVVRRSNASLDTLLHRNRSTRGYDSRVPVPEDLLRQMVAVNSLVASARNAQRLRFRLVNTSETCAKVLETLRMGGALPELHLPLPGTEPTAYIVVVPEADCKPDAELYIDLGISLQSMSLKAVEKGFNTLVIRAFDAQALAGVLGLKQMPMAVLAVGKSKEHIFLKPASPGTSLSYYRKDGNHYVPKLQPEDLLV